MSLAPSKVSCTLHCLGVAASLRACFFHDLPLVLSVSGTALVVLWIAWGLHHGSRVTEIAHDLQGRWWLRNRGRWVGGQLASGCYRGRWLILLALRDDRGRVMHAPVWRDSLPARDFSYLQLQLLLTPTDTLA